MKVYKQIYIVIVGVCIIIISGCNSDIIPLKGQYQESPYKITSAKPVDSIWSIINQLFAEKGLLIKKLQKEAGVIISTKSSFIPAYSFEDKDGKLIEPDAWIVLSEVWVNKKKWNPHKIFCKWNIQVTKAEKGISTIKVDPVVICTYHPNIVTTMEEHGQSTGKFEALLERSLTNN